MKRVGQLGQGLVTPAAMQARLDQLRAAARTLALAASQYVPPPTERERWGAWSQTLAEWLATFEAYQPDWADRLWGDTANQIESYATQLSELRQGFAAFPGHGDPGPDPGTATSLGDVLKSGLSGIGTGVGFALSVAVLGIGAFWLLSRKGDR